MQRFDYAVKDREGKVFTGMLTADGTSCAVCQLREKGYFITQLRKTGLLSRFSRREDLIRFFVSGKQKAIFTHQLATLLGAGVRLTTALGTLSHQMKNRRFGELIDEIRENVDDSLSLSEAMGKHRGVFSDVYTAIVGASEKSGSLAETLELLAGQLRRQGQIRGKIFAAMVYPIFLLVVSTVVVTVLMTFVIPRFLSIFVNSNTALPGATRVLIVVTGIFKEYWEIGPVVVVSGVVLGVLMRRNDAWGLLLDGLLMKLPLLGKISRKGQAARFCRTLGSLLKGGVETMEAIGTSRRACSNRAFARRVTEIEEKMFKGSSLAEAVRGEELMGEIGANMIAVGEGTGMLSEMLTEVADMYEEECSEAVGAVTSLLGPALIFIMGGIIGFVVVAVLMPVFQAGSITG